MPGETNRRQFMKRVTAGAAGALTLHGTTAAIAASDGIAGSGDLEWELVKHAYTPGRDMINLNNAGVSPQPRLVQDAMIEAYRFANELPDVNMWNVLDDARGRTKEKLARLVDCKPAEVALNRNSTEGLCTAIFGVDLAPGDEVVLAEWDYESMRHAWEQRERRHGVVLRRLEFDLMADDDEIVEAYRRAMNGKTRVVHMTHMIHYTGRVLPVKRLCDLAREHGALSIVDAAQSFAQIPTSFSRIGCDFLAASLHKWLCAPFGTGMLVVRESRIPRLWPLLAPFVSDPEGLGKIEGSSLGTYSSPAEHAIEPAVDFHNRLGTARIHARLRELSRYWIDRASGIPGFRLHTPLDDDALAGIATFSIDGLPVERIEQELGERHRVRVRFRKRLAFSGVRVSPHIYTSFEDLDRFVTGLRDVRRGG